MAISPRKSSSRILLVEGPNDRHIIQSLLKPRNFSVLLPGEQELEDETIPGTSGIEALLKDFPVRLKENHEVLGIVVDADLNLSTRWQAIRDRLLRSGYSSIPKEPPTEGFILESPDPFLPRFGAWLMPNNQDIGTMEDFIRLLIPAEDELSGYATRILNEIEAVDLQRYAPKDRSKAFIHTWLAWQKKPEMRIGQAITAKVLEKDAPIAASFTHWLRKLFLTTG
jgi:hypothetical protein